ncbi:MAG: cysteine synthase A [Candidatus Eremiobacteraeota bacterium]|nr:cysteine synthase A [Candidatus Eremiobacteraeota bacterium]MBC5826851.1 cysteine synthase A [Candidatus Eremiobacteraeota bacterium]
MVATADARENRDLFAAIGNTPLIYLRKVSKAIGRTILGKAEFVNPGGSVKDRTAKFIIEDAEKKGALQPGNAIVEGTAGNTGIALAMLGNARGYHCIIFVPDDQSPEKFALLKAYGADVRPVPVVSFADERNYYHQARRLAASTPKTFWADQFNNIANRRGHYTTTGPEIWEAAGGYLTAFVAAAGTGGTFAGVSAALKERKPSIRCVVADPMGSSLYRYIKDGTLDFEGDSIVEGIGIKRVTENFAGAPADDAVRVDDATMVEMAFFLLREEGLLLGGSAALNVAAAARVGARLPPGSTVVTILCDGGGRSLSRLYNPQWLAEKGLSPRCDGLSFL